MSQEPEQAPGFYCHTCGEYHDYLPMSVGVDFPYNWGEPNDDDPRDLDYCTIEADGIHYFIRGTLEIPVINGPGPFVWGVWTTLSEANYNRAIQIHKDDAARSTEEPYFGWLASSLPGYPETLNLKTNVHLRPHGFRPWIELEPTDHPLAIEQREGITMSRVHEILRMTGFLD